MGAVGEHEEAMESETCGFPSPIVQPIERATQVTQEGSPTEEVQRDTQPAEVTTICRDKKAIESCKSSM